MHFYGWMHKILMQKNVTLYCHLWYGPLLCSPSLLFLPHHKIVWSLFPPHQSIIHILRAIFIACTDDNWLDGSYSIHRLIWWTLMAKLGLRMFGSTSSISTWCNEFWLARGGKASSTCLNDPWQYTLTEMSENINHYVVFLVQHQLF